MRLNHRYVALLAATTLLVIALDATAFIINVPEDRGTIQAGIDAARAGDTVLVWPGTYEENITFGAREMVVGSLILTTGDRAYIDSTVIDGQARGAGAVFSQADVSPVLRGFTVQNGIQDYGGGIDCRAGLPQLIDLHVTHNTAREMGGGIYCTRGARPTIEHCLIDSNSAGTYGGAGLMAYSDSYALIKHSQFVGNSMADSRDGGAILLWSAGLEMESVDVYGNSSNQASGVITFNADTVLLRSCNFHHNLTTGYYGSGVDLYDSEVIVIQDCSFLNDDPEGQYRRVGVSIGTEDEYGFGGEVLIERTVISDNSPAQGFGFGLWCCRATLNNLTVVNTSRQAGPTIRWGESEVVVRNSIFFAEPNSIVVDSWQGGQVEPSLDIDYSDLAGGRESISFTGDDREPQLTFGEHNIDSDPLFVDPENGDFHLSDNSPCIDTGDPESPADLDQTRADMGAFPFTHQGGFIGGVVLDSRTNQPVPRAELHAVDVMINETPRDIFMHSDSMGIWGGWLNIFFRDTIFFDFWVTAPQHSHTSFQAALAFNDSLWIEVHLGAADFIPSSDSISVEVDSNSFASIPFSIQNDGDGELHWAADGHALEDANLAPWTLRQTIPISQVTDDDRIEGVIFDGENFYASGANGNDSNLIYVLNREGALIDSFLQASNSRYGMKDLEWDGELIWGSGDEEVYGFDREGTLHASWRGPNNPNNSIAYDSEEGILWLAGVTTNYTAYDRNGNDLGMELNRHSFRTYGLAWYADDPDGCGLYILVVPGGDALPCVYKMNVQTGDTMRVNDLILPEGATGVGGGVICNNYDRYKSAVFAYTVNVQSANGGDLIQVRQLEPNREWLTVDPTEGDIAAGESMWVEIVIRSAAPDSDWVFDLGEYDGEVVFSHDGAGGQMILPVHLIVRPPNSSDPAESPIPMDFGFQSLYPQPFNSTLTVNYNLERSGEMRLALTDLTGREFAVLREGFGVAGEYRVTADYLGLPSGVYMLRLESAGRVDVAKVICLK